MSSSDSGESMIYSDDDEESRTSDEDDIESTTSDNDEESRTSEGDEESRTSDDDEENRTEESRTSDEEEDNKTSESDEKRNSSDDDEESTTSDSDEESWISSASSANLTCLKYMKKKEEAELKLKNVKLKLKKAESKLMASQSKREAFKTEFYKKIHKALEEDFNCCICSEIFIKASVLDCNHTFCLHCIEEWRRNGNRRCPLCRRKSSRRLSSHNGMTSFIKNLYDHLPKDVRKRRRELTRERARHEKS